MYLLMYLACTSKQRTWKKCDKTMKSTLFIRAPMIAACSPLLASPGFQYNSGCRVSFERLENVVFE